MEFKVIVSLDQKSIDVLDRLAVAVGLTVCSPATRSLLGGDTNAAPARLLTDAQATREQVRAEVDQAADVPAKRGRGRPKKKPEPIAAVEDDSDEDGELDEDAEDVAEDDSDEDAGDVAEDDECEDEDDEDDAPAPEAKATKAKGRPAAVADGAGDERISEDQVERLKAALRAYSKKWGKESALKVLNKCARTSADVRKKDLKKLLEQLKL